jgi:glycosyltransferase involved in cell wall biosynthesis
VEGGFEGINMKKKKRNDRAKKHHTGCDPTLKAPRLSLCMIVKNEARNLECCIQPLKPVLDEIIVVDTGSTDETREIARGLGAKVFDFPWCDDFAAARNESIKYATGDYILWLDADDRLAESEVKKIGLLKTRFPFSKNEAYYLIVNSQSPVDGETSFFQLRIFPRLKGILFEGRVHEQVFYALGRKGVQFVQTDIMVRHFGYHDVSTIFQKSERNLQILQKDLESNPDNLLTHYYIGRTLSGINRQAEAILHMKKITDNERIRNQEKQFFLESSILLGKYHTELRHYDEAISIFRSLSKEFQGNGLVYFCLGHALLLAKDYEGAIEALRNSLLFPVEVSLFPVNLEELCYSQHSLLEQCYLETGQADLAREVSSRFLTSHKDHAKSLEILGLSSLKDHQFKEAAIHFEKAIEKGGGSDRNYANLGLAYRKTGLWAEAEKAFLKALEINPERIEALTNLGYLYYQRKDSQKARDYFAKSLDVEPNLIDVRLALSDIYFRSYDLENLVNQCDALLKGLHLPRDIVLNDFRDLGLLYEKMGDLLSQNGQEEFADRAYHVSFLIFPNPTLVEKVAPAAASLNAGGHSLERINEALAFHGVKARMEQH